MAEATLSFTVAAEVPGRERPAAVFGQVSYDPGAAPARTSPVSGEATYALEDPAAALWIDGAAYDARAFEIRVADDLNVNNRGILFVDRLTFVAVETGAEGFRLSVGAAELDLSTLRGTGLPEAPLGPFDVGNEFGTDLRAPALAPGEIEAEIVRFEIAAAPIPLAEAIGAGLAPEEAERVALLYEAALDRDGEIDAGGLNFWIDAREHGLSERALAEAFLGSGEFAAAFGAPETVSDRALVEQLYENVLDREGEGDGVDFWTAALGQEGFARRDLLLAFAESPENREGAAFLDGLEEIAPGVWDIL